LNVLDEEEAKAWDLSFFPHLFLPDLVEAHIATLGLEPVHTTHDNIVAPSIFTPRELAVGVLRSKRQRPIAT
jgi:hypothetical protein